MKFKILAKDAKSKARTGTIELERGIINTPIFMPVGTLGTVRGVHQSEIINDIKAEIILGNTYHLYLRPTLDVIQEAGGIHNFINYHQPILTDSGGYQVYSLSDNRKIKEEGVRFQSHIDGSTHFFTPENVMDIQRTIGADIIMAFDECTPYPCEYNYVKKSMELTHRWLKRCKIRFEETEHKYDYKQTLLPIVQGGTYKELRKILSTKKIDDFVFAGSSGKPLHSADFSSILFQITQEHFYPHIIRSHHADSKCLKFLDGESEIEDPEKLFLDIAKDLGHKKYNRKKEVWEISPNITIQNYIYPGYVEKIRTRKK